jgi:hypothetical protein
MRDYAHVLNFDVRESKDAAQAARMETPTMKYRRG